MGRLIRLNKFYFRTYRSIGLKPRSDEGKDVARAINEIADAKPLPGPQDQAIRIEPGGTPALSRKVQDRNLWLIYRRSQDDTIVQFITVKRSPPTPL